MTNMSSSDSMLGQIFIGVVVAVVSALISWFVSRATHVPPPLPKPEAVISPSQIVAPSNEFIEFSAAASSWPSDNSPIYKWTIGGLPVNKSPIANCTENNSSLRCRFILPGTFAVSVTIEDKNGQADIGVSSVTVALADGYLGLIFKSENKKAMQAILYDIDWVFLQSLVSRPIVLVDPNTNLPIYAALAEPPDNVTEPPNWRSEAGGLKIGIPQLPTNARNALEDALREIGASPIPLGFNEVRKAVQAGQASSGFTLIESPESLPELNEQ